ncbi:hypothetical protein [Zobellia uliginosa]|uniref:hypothetical protein n=1 Tax=Zobellia uliginosa TaxID=143224 RepID=UPI0026E14FAD|nr:hypothetical protein [Zobellia uliginosa]MDO6519473.1 hypothetical protein [Zobellia uliginosa]
MILSPKVSSSNYYFCINFRRTELSFLSFKLPLTTTLKMRIPSANGFDLADYFDSGPKTS